ncbi:MAG: hypothetical protein JST94_07175 [Bacteroidetes bacterium]|nr:hypothetical protein [Bacteroidota bacterium]MBS1671219.1 hypothetical protein [Bacteroidota bacterium]
MSNTIRTYNNLLEEKKRLQELLLVQKATLKNNVTELKTEIKPAFFVLNFLKQISSVKKKHYIINSITNWFKESVSENGWLKKNKWLLQIIISFALKNIATYFFQKKENNS